MMAHCFVKDCQTILPTFSPTDFFVDLWVESLPPRERQFDRHADAVCSAHFEKHFIVQEPVYKLGGTGTEIARIKYSLKPGAIPTIFGTTEIDIKHEPPDNSTDNKNKGGLRTTGKEADLPKGIDTIEKDEDDDLLAPKSGEESNSESCNDDDDNHDDLGAEIRSFNPVHTKYERRFQKKERRRKKLYFVKRKSHKTTIPNAATAATTTTPPNDDNLLTNKETFEEEGEESSQWPFQIEKQQEENHDTENTNSNKSPLSSEVREDDTRGNSVFLAPVQRKPGRPRKNFASKASRPVLSPPKNNNNNLAAAKIIKTYGKKNLNKTNTTTSLSPKDDLSLSSPPQQQHLLDLGSQSSLSQTTFKTISVQISSKRESAMSTSEVSSCDDDESPPSKLSKQIQGRPISLLCNEKGFERSPSPLSRRLSSSPEKSPKDSVHSQKSIKYTGERMNQPFDVPSGPRMCFALSCLQRCKKMFHPPKDDEALFDRWLDVVPKRERPLTEKDFICADHFTQESIKRQVLTAKGNFFPLPILRWQLLPGAVPQLFRFPKVTLTRIDLSDVHKVIREFNEREAERSRVANQKKKRGRKRKDGLNNEKKKQQPALSSKVLYNCVVPGCVRPEGKRLVFHEFPIFINYRNLWAREISRKSGIDIPSTVSFLAGKRVCSQHFERSDYVGHSINNALKSSAVPSKFNLVDKETTTLSILPDPDLDLDKEDCSDLEITYVQTSSAERRNNRLMGRCGTNKRKNFVSTKVPTPVVVTPVMKTSPQKNTLSKKKITESLGEMAADWIEKIKNAASSSTLPKILTTSTTTIPMGSKSEMSKKTPVPSLPPKETSNSISAPNNNITKNKVQMPVSTSNVTGSIPTILLLNNCMNTPQMTVAGTTMIQPGNIYQTLPFVQTTPMIVVPSSPSTTTHEVPVAPIALVNSQAPTMDKPKKNFKATVIPKASKYVISHKHGKALVSLYNETNLPQITKTIVTPNQGKISFPCPKEEELVLIVVQNWETKKTSFSCNRAHSLLTVTNEQLFDVPNSTMQPTQGEEENLRNVTNKINSPQKFAAAVASKLQQQVKNGAWNSKKKVLVGSNVNHDSDVEDNYPHDSESISDDDFKKSVTNCRNFCHEAKAATQGTKSGHNKPVQSGDGKSKASSSMVIPTLFLDSTKHGIDEMLKWIGIIKLPDQNSWSVKLLTDNNKTKPGKYLFVSEVVVREGNLILQRVLKIKQDFKFEARVHDTDFTSMFNEENDTIKSYPRLQEVIDDFSSFNICSGLEGFSYVQESVLAGSGKRRGDTWFSGKCDILSVDNICSPCLSLLESLINQRNKVKTSSACPVPDQSHSPSTIQLANELVTLRGSQQPILQRTGAPLTKTTLTTSHCVAAGNPSNVSSKSITTLPISIIQQVGKGASPSINNAILRPRSELNFGTPRATATRSPVPGKTKFVVRHISSHPQPQNSNCKSSNMSETQSRQVSSPAPARTPVPPQSSPALPRTPVPAQTPPPAAATSGIVYSSLTPQSLVYGSTVGNSHSQTNYSVRNTDVSTNCLQQQQQQQQSQSTQSNIYGNPSGYSVSLAYANSSQQNATIQQQQNNNNYVKSSAMNVQSLQTNQPILYYPSLQPLHFQSSDIYGKPFQTPALVHSQPQSVRASYLNFGTGAAGTLTQQKISEVNSHSQNTVVVSASGGGGGPQQNYSLNSSSGPTQNMQPMAVANAGVTSFTVPSSTVFSYYPYTQQ